MEEAQWAGPLLLGDHWSLWEWGCKGIGSSIIKDAEKVGRGVVVGGEACVLLHMVYVVIKAGRAALLRLQTEKNIIRAPL